ncbi:hypothetical protein ABZ371_26205 [Streptomyces sp. NPDC005899]|uniref:hypothetical protein n=1 Tax=Streptomyces sp. NPDC005899 TaxID=3155716 RepID=UPI0033FD2952
MPDRLRTAFGHPLPERASTLMRERRPSSPGSSSPDSSSGSSPGSSAPDSAGSGASGSPGGSPSRGSSAPSDDNPFAAPPEDRPDQPWQPRHPSPGRGDQGGEGGGDPSDDRRPVWGSQWSDRQPGRQNGGFGSRPGGAGGPDGPGGPEGGPGGVRWDPTDPAQRRARYALLGGMWAFFFALFDFPEIALLLGALAVYWAISALRASPGSTPATGAGTATAGSEAARTPGSTSGETPDRAPSATAPAAASGAGRSGRQQTTAAVSGLVTALLALAIVATGYTVQLVYRDYYTCVNDALTKTGAMACNDRLPDPLEPFFGLKE